MDPKLLASGSDDAKGIDVKIPLKVVLHSVLNGLNH